MTKDQRLKTKDRNFLKVCSLWSVVCSLLFLLLVVSCLADFKDIPEKHWASEAVYELVKLGVTQGFPDGTFRGMKKITRFEIAGFINNLASQTGQALESKKLISELKTEYNLEKYRIENPTLPVLTADLAANYFLSQKPSGKNIITDYRAILNLKRKNDFKITFDTMDSGFNSSTQRNIPQDLIDFESGFKFLDVDFNVSFGGGDIIHEDSLIPERDGVIFQRKMPSLSASIQKNHVMVNSAYTVLSNSSSGMVNTQDLSFGLGYKGGFFKTSVSAHYSKKSEEHALIGLINLDYIFSKDAQIGLNVGSGSSGTSGLFAGANLKLGNLKISAARAGSNFRRAGINKYNFLPLNLFDKYILDGTCDLGLSYLHEINENLGLNLKSDLVLSGDYKYGENYPGTSLTSEINLALKLNRSSKASLFYRLFESPSSSPTRSDMLGLSLGIEL